MIYLKCKEYFELCGKAFIDTYTEAYRAEHPVLKLAQIKKNYDYGDGLYSNLNEYKSVGDFRRKRRKARIKAIKDIIDTRPDRNGGAANKT